MILSQFSHGFFWRHLIIAFILLQEKKSSALPMNYPEKLYKCSVDSRLVVAIAMTMECKQYRTGKFQCTM